MDHLVWIAEILRRSPSTLKLRRDAIRLPHLVRGLNDFSLRARRANDLTKCIANAHRRMRERPFRTDLLRWERQAMGGNNEQWSGLELVTSAVTGFFFLLRISAIGRLKASGISIDEGGESGGIVSCIMSSKTDKMGKCIYRTLRSSNNAMRLVICMKKRHNRQQGGRYGDDNFPGVKIPARLGFSTKAAAVSSGVWATSINTHSLREGGSTSL